MHKTLLIGFLAFAFSCGQTAKDTAESVPTNEGSLKKNTIRYVFAPSGLNLRADPALNARVLAKLTFGTEVVVDPVLVGAEMVVEGLKGQMVKVTADTVAGYVFNGFLGKLPAPQNRDIEQYAKQLKAAGVAAVYKTWEVPASDSNHYEVHHTLSLPGSNDLQGWQECWLIAHRLGFMDHQEEFVFAFPGPDRNAALTNLINGQKIAVRSREQQSDGSRLEDYQIDALEVSDHLWFIGIEIATDDQGQYISLSEQIRAEGYGQSMAIDRQGDQFVLTTMSFAD